MSEQYKAERIEIKAGFVIWVIGPHEKPNISERTVLGLTPTIQKMLNEGKDVVIKYKGSDEAFVVDQHMRPKYTWEDLP